MHRILLVSFDVQFPLHIWNDISLFFPYYSDATIDFVSHTGYTFTESISKKIAKELTTWHTDKYFDLRHKIHETSFQRRVGKEDTESAHCILCL